MDAMRLAGPFQSFGKISRISVVSNRVDDVVVWTSTLVTRRQFVKPFSQPSGFGTVGATRLRPGAMIPAGVLCMTGCLNYFGISSAPPPTSGMGSAAQGPVFSSCSMNFAGASASSYLR